jgi:hypothetical protein
VGKRGDFGDGAGAGAEHDETVDAESVAARGRHAFAERSEEAAIEGVRAAAFALASKALGFEAALLLVRIGELPVTP